MGLPSRPAAAYTLIQNIAAMPTQHYFFSSFALFIFLTEFNKRHINLITSLSQQGQPYGPGGLLDYLLYFNLVVKNF